MDFFAHQDLARRQTKRLVVLFILAVIGVIIAVNLATAIIYLMFIPSKGVPFNKFTHLLSLIPDKLWVIATLGALFVIVLGTTIKLFQMARGGAAVAEMIGARLVKRDSKDPAEKRYLNLVEEMALASGTSVPQTYVMDQENSINAFAAGYSPNEAVVAISRGALTSLSRDELQGVIAHEFSHILNGDMRLNIHLIGLLNGIVFIGSLGLFILRNAGRVRSGNDSKGALPILLFGLLLTIIGYIGIFFARLIKSAVSRQREFLADASAIQFTRNPHGIGGALDKIRLGVQGIANRHAEDLSHMFFSQALTNRLANLFDTHPPLEERLRRIGYSMEKTAATSKEAADMLSTQSWMRVHEFGQLNQLEQASALTSTSSSTPNVVETTPRAIMASIGNPSSLHVEQAARLIHSLPETLHEAIATVTGAKAAIYALFLDKDKTIREKQIQLLSTAGEKNNVHQAEEFAPMLATLGQKIRLPVVDMATPSLKELPQLERDAFLENLQKLIACDNKTTLQEFTLKTILDQRLQPKAARLQRTRYSDIAQLQPELLLLLSLLAYSGNSTSVTVSQAFLRGWKKLGLATEVQIFSIKEIQLKKVEEALGKINLLTPLKKPVFIKACLETVLADGKTTLSELELMRALCAAIDSPMPPILGAGAKS